MKHTINIIIIRIININIVSKKGRKMDKTNISITNVMVFRKDHESRDGTWYTYYIGYSKKNPDGSYKNKYREVKFKKDEVVANKTIIDIDESFLTFRSYTDKGGKEVDVDYLMILDYKIVKPADDVPGFASLQDDDIPF